MRIPKTNAYRYEEQQKSMTKIMEKRGDHFTNHEIFKNWRNRYDKVE